MLQSVLSNKTECIHPHLASKKPGVQGVLREVPGSLYRTLVTEPGLECRPQTPVALIFLPQPVNAGKQLN